MRHSLHVMQMMITGFAVILLAGCASTLDRLEQVGQQPPITKVENPQEKPDYQELTWPLPEPQVEQKRHANALWQPGARAFFRDQRASRIGDILRVKIEIDDKAELDNETERTRDTQEAVGAPKLFGLEGKLKFLTPGTPEPANLFDITGTSTNEGTGSIAREEKIETQVAAVITQVLPNGNYVIDGSQEIRVNFEVREVSVKGIVRPQDIDSENTVDYSKIAMARINYGGRGHLMDVQQPRYGSQIVDILSPF